MLTDNDLKKIGEVVDQKIEEKVGPIIEKHLRPVKEDISHIRKDIKTMVGYFDREYLDLRKRVERIESHLKISVS